MPQIHWQVVQQFPHHIIAGIDVRIRVFEFVDVQSASNQLVSAGGYQTAVSSAVCIDFVATSDPLSQVEHGDIAVASLAYSDK